MCSNHGALGWNHVLAHAMQGNKINKQSEEMLVKQILPTSVKDLKEAIFICLIIGFTY